MELLGLAVRVVEREEEGFSIGLLKPMDVVGDGMGLGGVGIQRIISKMLVLLGF